MTGKNSDSGDAIRAAILGLTDDMKPQPVEVPEWGMTLFVKPLNGDERFSLSRIASASLADTTKTKNYYVTEAYVALGVCTEDGESVFTLDDLPELAKRNPVVIDRLRKEVARASGIAVDVEDNPELEAGKA